MSASFYWSHDTEQSRDYESVVLTNLAAGEIKPNLRLIWRGGIDFIPGVMRYQRTRGEIDRECCHCWVT